MNSASKVVLVTGGSGFISGHCILLLLEQGYRVHTTVRSLQQEADVRAVLGDAGMTKGDALRFFAADLTRDGGWAEAVAGCDFVLHMASPVQTGHVENPDDVIVPAREGALRVLRAARDEGVERVVLTSAFHAVAYGYPHTDRMFTDDDWSILDAPNVTAYTKSKTLAERAAWDFMDADSGSMELVTLLPVAVMGPVMGKQISGANHIIQRSLNGAMPGYPDLWIPIVDVRDVASAHLLAMTVADAAGERFIVSSGAGMPLRNIGAILKEHLGDAAKYVPTRSIPSIVVRLGSIFNKEFRTLVPDLGFAKKMSSEKAQRILGWTPRPSEDAILAAARSLVKKQLVKV